MEKPITFFEYNEIRTKLIQDLKSVIGTLEYIRDSEGSNAFLLQDTSLIDCTPEMLMRINKLWCDFYNNKVQKS